MAKFKCPVIKGNSDTQRSSYQRRKNNNSSFSFQHLPIPPWHKDRRDALAMAPRLNSSQNHWCGVQQKLWSEQHGMFSCSHSARSGFIDLPEGPGRGCLGALGLYFGFQLIKQNCNTFSCGTWSQNRIWALYICSKKIHFCPFPEINAHRQGKNGFVPQADYVFSQENQIFKHQSSF